MTRVVSCPSCQKRLKIPIEKLGRAIKCPACNKPFKTQKPASAEGESEFNDLLAEDELSAPPTHQGRSTPRNGERASSGRYPIQPFLKRWSTILGGVCGVALLISLGGFASEAIALAGAGVCVVAIIAFVLIGRIWMSIDLGRDKVWLGLVSFFVPLVGLVITFRQRGPSLRGAVVYMSALAPALLGLGIVSVFQPMHSAQGKAAARASRADSNLDSLESRISADAPIETASYRLGGQIPATLAADTERLLSKYSMFVSGSAQVDAAARTLTVEYRGGRVVMLGFGIYLSSKIDRLMVTPQIGTNATEAADVSKVQNGSTNEGSGE